MATRRKKKVPKIKFEVSRSGIAGIGVVIFCLFLWMFLLGIWAGQSLMLSGADKDKRVKVEKQKTAAEVPLLENAGRVKKIHQQ